QFTRSHGFKDVVNHDTETQQIKGAAQAANGIHGNDLGNGFQKVGVLEITFWGELFPHQTLGNTAPIHGYHPEYHAECAYPKMPISKFLAVQFHIEHAWYQPVNYGKGEKAVPAQGAYVYVCWNPVGKVAQSIHRFERVHRS